MSPAPKIYFRPDITIEQRRRVQDWIEALRSGEYAQGQEALRSSEGYCCLGVACAIAPEISEETKAKYPDIFDDRWIYSYTDSTGRPNWSEAFLPEGAEDLYGLFSSNGRPCEGTTDTLDDGKWALLWDLNDEGWSFAQIADLLEMAVNGRSLDEIRPLRDHYEREHGRD
jgi:hypothetical protein